MLSGFGFSLGHGDSIRRGALLGVIALTCLPHRIASKAETREANPVDREVRWVEVEGGAFLMGSRGSSRRVAVRGFMMSATEITFDQYDAFCDATGKPKPDDHGWGRGTQPVLNVSYDDAEEFGRWLSGRLGTTVRLPTEAEWEYAAQGGLHSRGFAFSGSNDRDEVSWNEGNSGGRPHPVGTKKANELGLFDLSGNLWEWCADDAAPEGDGVKRPLRGNSFDNPGTRLDFRDSLRLERESRHYNIGFRVVRENQSRDG
jgi:formylglycine-generating enzyme required for sulfatase activity